MIERQKKEFGWEFLFLGANIDAVAEAERLGIDPTRAVKYRCDERGTAVNYQAVSEAVCMFRQNRVIPDEWKDEIEEDYRNRSGK